MATVDSTNSESTNFSRALKQGHVLKPNSEESESKIWSKFKKGDNKAFSWIYKEYVNQLFNYGHQFTNDRELVKDAIHDLFIFLRNKRHSISDVQCIKPYLFKSLRREIIRKIKREKKFVDFDINSQNNPFGITFSPEVNLINQQHLLEKKQWLESAFSRLTEKQREAIILYYYEDFTYQDIGQVMGIKLIKSVRKLIYRALDTLRGTPV